MTKLALGIEFAENTKLTEISVLSACLANLSAVVLTKAKAFRRRRMRFVVKIIRALVVKINYRVSSIKYPDTLFT